MKQLEIHKKIDLFLSGDPVQAKKDEAVALIAVNEDAKRYFFSVAPANWLDWLDENGFLNAIKQKAENPKQYSYQLSELNYISRIVSEKPEKVTDILLSTPISKDNFNPEVIDQFLRICGSLPPVQLARIVPKIRDEKWVQLMGVFNHLDFAYERIVERLKEAGDFDSIRVLAEAIFSIKPKAEKEEKYSFLSDNLFYFSNLSDTKIFESLAKMNKENLEKALSFTTGIMKEVILLSARDGKEDVFKVYDSFALYDVDFFNLKLSEKNRFSHRDDIKNLAAIIKYYAEELIGKQCGNLELTRRIYETYFEPLPDSRSMWRLKLFVLSLCPQNFKEELKNAFFRLFDTDHYHEVISGTEYENALKRSFSIFSKTEKSEYVQKVIAYFVKKDAEKESEKENWHFTYGSQILSMISDFLTEEEKKIAEKSGFSVNSEYKPQADLNEIRSGTIAPRAPVEKREFEKLPIQEIVEKLKGEWSPKALNEKYKGEDEFFRPRNAEGVGEELKGNIPERTQDYINSSSLFFERSNLDPHYTYSFLRGVQDLIRNDSIDKTGIDWSNLISVCSVIGESGKEKIFERNKRDRDSFDGWLAGWDAVHSAMADVIQELLNERSGTVYVDFVKHRTQLFSVISYLLCHSDPEVSAEKIETATSTTKSYGNSDYSISDPYSMAINTVRGRAFQALVLFVYQDGKRFSKEEEIKIAPEVKEIYAAVVKEEKTRAIMFMFGRYFASFYFRDKKWLTNLMPFIFPEDPEKKYLYIAAWEGYLSENLYVDMFRDPLIQRLYERGIELTDSELPNQRHFKEPDEGIANHLALAYIYSDSFDFKHPLFKKFWENGRVDQQADFISFLGRLFVSGSNVNADDFLKKNPQAKQRLIDIWDYILKNSTDPKIFIEVGSWIDLQKGIFEPKWLASHIKEALQKTNGEMDWDYGLTKSVIELAQVAPEDMLAVGRLYFLEGGIRKGNQRRPFNVDKEWYDAFKILYENPKTKEGVISLIDDLVKEGSVPFWHLKGILK